MVIYKITNKINNKVYIGKDKQNKPECYGSGLLIKRAIKKYCKINSTKDIIETCKNNIELSEKEKNWINQYNSTDLSVGYNITKGGDGGDTISNNPNKKDICLKISKNSIKKGKTYEECFGKEYAKIWSNMDNDKKEKIFLEFFEPIKNVIILNNIKQLEQYYSSTESKSIRKKLLNSKFRYLINDYIIKIKKINIKNKKISEKFYRNISKKIKINNIVYKSISDASKKNKY